MAAALVAVGTLGVGAVGVLGVRALSNDSGGASSPQGAAESLIAALEEEDPLAALAVMNPSEVEALTDVVTAASERAAELGFAAEDRTFGGVDLTVASERLEVDEIGDDIARVTLASGSAEVGVDRDALGTSTRSILDVAGADEDGLEVTRDSLTLHGDQGPIEPFVITVKRDGGWYVSPLYTAAQYLADYFDLPGADVGEADQGEGADSPEAAVEALLLGAGAGDSAAVGDLASGDAGRAVRTYGGTLEAFLARAGEEVSAEIDTFETSVEDRDGGGKRVVITDMAGTVTWTDPDDGDAQTRAVAWDGTCLFLTDSAEGESIGGDDDQPGDVCLTEPWKRVGVDELAVAVTEEGGQWRVDPLATVTDYATVIVPELTEPLVLRFLERPEAAAPTQQLSAGEPLDVELSEAGTAVIGVELTAGERVTINASNADEDEPVYAYLISPSGERSSPYRLIEPDEDGEHRLVVFTEGWAAAAVNVSLSPIVEEEISLGTTVSGDLPTGAEVLEYTIDLDADTSYEVTFETTDDLDVQVLGPDGEELGGQADLDDEGPFDITTAESGTHRLRVDGGFSRSAGDFDLTIEEGRSFVLGDGSTDRAEGELANADSEQFIDLEVRGGARATADITTTDPTLDLVVIIRDPDDDSEIDRYDTGGPGAGESIVFHPTDTTTFRIAVQGKNGSTGRFQIDAFEGG